MLLFPLFGRSLDVTWGGMVKHFVVVWPLSTVLDDGLIDWFGDGPIGLLCCVLVLLCFDFVAGLDCGELVSVIDRTCHPRNRITTIIHYCLVVWLEGGVGRGSSLWMELLMDSHRSTIPRASCQSTKHPHQYVV